VVAALIIAVSALLVGIYISSLQNIVKSETLAAEAKAKSSSDPLAGLKQAVEAVQASPTESAESALRELWFKYSSRVPIPPVQDGSRRYGAITAVFSPDGQYVLTANRNGKAYIWRWDATTNAFEKKEKDVIDPKAGFITSASFNHSGTRIILTCENKQAMIMTFNSAVGKVEGGFIELNGHTEMINQAAFSADDKYVVTASSDGTARIWEINQGSGKQLAVLPHRAEKQIPSGKAKPIWVKSAVFNPSPGNSKYILTASWDGIARIWSWDALTGKGQLIKVRHHQDGINKAVFSQDGKYILTASNDGKSGIWEWDEAAGGFGKLLAVLSHDGPVLDAEFNPQDSKTVITGCADNRAYLWEWSPVEAGCNPSQSSNSQALNDPNDFILANTCNAHVKSLVKANSEVTTNSDWVTSVAYSQKTQYVLTAGYEGIVTLWRNIDQLEPLEKYLQRTPARRATALSPVVIRLSACGI